MKEILFTDMSLCQPSGAIARRRDKGIWKSVSYQAPPLRGVLLQAGPHAGAPDLYLPLQQTGWHHIWVAVAHTHAASSAFGISVKLTNDPGWTDILRDRPAGQPEVLMGYFKPAKLDGQALHIRVPRRFNPEFHASVAAVKLVAMTDSEVADHEAQLREAKTFPVVGDNDASSFYYWCHCEKPEDIVQQVEVFAQSDFSELAWEVMWGEALAVDQYEHYDGDPGSPWDQGRTSYLKLKAAGHDPTRIAVDHARHLGLKVVFEMRVHWGLWEPPFEEGKLPGLWIDDRPEFRCVDHDGIQIPRLSWAFPEVQDRLIERIRTTVSQYNVDAWNFIFHRSVPVILFERPVAEAFHAKHGIAMTSVAFDDPRLTEIRSSLLKDFLLRLKRVLQEDSGRQKREPVSLRANVLGTKKLNLKFGIDVAMWAKEGAIDVIVPYPWGEYWGPLGEEPEYDYFKECIAGTSTKLYFAIINRAWLAAKPPHWPPDKLIEDIVAYREKGASGFYLWDPWERMGDPARRYMLRRLGRAEGYDTLWDEAVRMNPVYALQSINGECIDRFPPWLAT